MNRGGCAPEPSAPSNAETVREYCLADPPAPKSGRSDRCSAEDGDGSLSTVPCFAVRAGERSSRPFSVPPQGQEIAEAEGDRIERADAHRLVVLCARDDGPREQDPYILTAIAIP